MLNIIWGVLLSFLGVKKKGQVIHLMLPIQSKVERRRCLCEGEGTAVEASYTTGVTIL